MRLKRQQKKHVRGWLPKTPSTVYVTQASTPRWRRPAWVALTLAVVAALAFAAYAGAQTHIRYSDPTADVTTAYFEKTANCTAASVGDTIEVTLDVYWHGYVVPEFKRQVVIVDPYPEGTFELVGGNNTCQYCGYGGDSQYHYQLKVVNSDQASVELPEPKLYLDNTGVPLGGESVQVELT